MNELQEYSYTQAARLLRMRRADFVKEYVLTKKVRVHQRGRLPHVLHRDIKAIQEQEFK
jgi:hypothetical protein